MSKESAIEFLERVDRDEEFKKEIAAAKDDEARWEIVKGAGFDFTKEDLRDAIQEKTGGELSDDELAHVTGGAIGLAAVATAGATAGTVVGQSVGHKIGEK